jgi:hypothetical protein
VTFGADPYPAPTPDPTPFFSDGDLKDAKKYFFSYNLSAGTLPGIFSFKNLIFC